MIWPVPMAVLTGSVVGADGVHEAVARATGDREVTPVRAVPFGTR